MKTLCDVYSQDKAIAEPVCRLLETTLRSTHLPSRMGALHGVLYVLECDLLDDTAKQLIPTVSDYLLSNLRAIAQCVFHLILQKVHRYTDMAHFKILELFVRMCSILLLK